MSKAKKLKMNTGKFRLILIPVMAFFLIFAIVVTAVTNYFTPSLDAFLGKGKRTASTPGGTSGWDSNYYSFDSKNGDEALKNSLAVSESIADEGIVLLKNDGLLPLSADTPVTPLGYRYFNPLMSGSGSGSADTTADYVYDAVKGITEAFTNVNASSLEAMKAGEVMQIDPEAASGEAGQTAFLGSSVSLFEFPVSIYEGMEDSCKDTVGIVFLGRAGGEGGDLYTNAYTDGTPHELALTDTERETLEYAKNNCSGVVVVLTSCNTMQIAELQDDDGINSIITMCTPGAVGFKSLGKILNGTVNPSGRTVDTFAADYTKTPTFVNFNDSTGKTSYNNASYTRDIWLSAFKGGPVFDARFREYEEGVYLGYRWYETSAEEGYFTSDNLPEGVTDPYYNRDNGVVYPFGYGLSYTTFSQEITSFEDGGSDIEVQVKVTNTGNADGKDVVQLYYSAPYTDFDKENSIEKSSVNLAAFDKTELLAPGESQTLTLSFPKEEMASYCYTHDNGNGTKGCYVMEEGAYTISLRSDSHTVIDSRTSDFEETFWYDGSDEAHIRQSEKDAQALLEDSGASTGTAANTELGFFAAHNQFEKASTYMNDPSVGNDVTILSRKDWAGTQPSAPTDVTRTASDTVKEWLDYGLITVDLGDGKSWDSVNDPILGSMEGTPVYTAEMPASGQKNGLTLSDLRGVDYFDPKWDALLDQVDYQSSEMKLALFANAFASGQLSAVDKPETVDHDG
ncbi:MAG: glycoside hydrolase family 3 C-terminal domain-containing protein, partial [bacterium]